MSTCVKDDLFLSSNLKDMCWRELRERLLTSSAMWIYKGNREHLQKTRKKQSASWSRSREGLGGLEGKAVWFVSEDMIRIRAATYVPIQNRYKTRRRWSQQLEHIWSFVHRAKFNFRVHLLPERIQKRRLEGNESHKQTTCLFSWVLFPCRWALDMKVYATVAML